MTIMVEVVVEQTVMGEPGAEVVEDGKVCRKSGWLLVYESTWRGQCGKYDRRHAEGKAG